MYVELIATLVAGIAAAGFVMLLNRLLGGLLPRWLAPVAAGAAMIATTVYNEYTWYERTRDALPDDMIVVQTVNSRAPYRPWTYAVPFVDRFAAADTATMRRHPAQPDMRLADVYFFGRWAAANVVPVLADCKHRKRAALTNGISFETDGRVEGVDWIEVTADDPLVATICGAG